MRIAERDFSSSFGSLDAAPLTHDSPGLRHPQREDDPPPPTPVVAPPQAPADGIDPIPWAWEAGPGPGPPDPFRDDWKHWRERGDGGRGGSIINDNSPQDGSGKFGRSAQ